VIGSIARWRPRLPQSTIGLATLAIVVVAFAAATGVLGFMWQSAQASQDAGTASMAAAQQKIPALLSYTAGSFQSDVARAEADSTPGFRGTYGHLMTTQIEPTALKEHVVTAATVSDTSVVSASSDSATLLVFVNQQTKTDAKAESVLNDTAIKVTMKNVGGNWLVDNMTPES
jgi:Mce-associated membrane protein